jgi:DNA-binding transcriptional LysR family regulator
VDIAQLKTFLEVSRQKSFSRAAQRLMVTQPSVSAQIRSLEKFLGCRLFERGGGKVTLTSAGRLFEPYAEDSLTRLNHLQLALGDLERSPRGTLTVSANDSTALYVLPTFFSKFKRQHPRVSLDVVRAPRAQTLELVLNREVDFGIVSLPVKDPRLHVEVVHNDELVLVVPSSHPFASQETISVTELTQARLLMMKNGRRREGLEQIFAQYKVMPRIVMELDSQELMKRLILAQIGIGFLPRINVLEEIRMGQLASLTLKETSFPRDLALVFRNDRVLNRAAEVFHFVATGQRLAYVPNGNGATP